jgi:hypothetical protein
MACLGCGCTIQRSTPSQAPPTCVSDPVQPVSRQTQVNIKNKRIPGFGSFNHSHQIRNIPVYLPKPGINPSHKVTGRKYSPSKQDKNVKQLLSSCGKIIPALFYFTGRL